MILITRTYETLSPSGGCRNFIIHNEVKCFDNNDLKGVEDFMNESESELRKKTYGYTIYSLHYDVKKL